MNLIHLFSAHRVSGWQGQYSRMIRWAIKFNELSFIENKDENSHEYFDVMYACFQNIFFLKDWLDQDSTIPKESLNNFVNNNIEIGVCRDICNGTKHYNVERPSIDKEFSIIRSYNSSHEVSDTSKWNIIICAGGVIYKPFDLINRCIALWDDMLFSFGLEKPFR